MQISDPSYEAICSEVWALYEKLRQVRTTNGRPRNVLLPPPRRQPRVDVLFVGIAPNQRAEIDFVQNFDRVRDFARKFRYVDGDGATAGSHYQFYYPELMNFIRRVDRRFGVWWEVERGDRKFLVEFTDALHVASEPGKEDIVKLIESQNPECPTRRSCRKILEMELRYYAPRVVIGNGRLPSDLLTEIVTGAHQRGAPSAAFLHSSALDCNVHLSGFITSKSLDGYSKTRLIEEIKTHSEFLSQR